MIFPGAVRPQGPAGEARFARRARSVRWARGGRWARGARRARGGQARSARPARGVFGTWPDVLRVPFRALSLDPPMILVLVDRGALSGPGQARFADAGRVAPTRTRRVRRREGRFRDMSGCLKGAPQDAQRPKGHPQDIGPCPETAPHGLGAARPAREAGFARRAMPNGQAPAKSIGGFRLSVLKGTLKALQLSRKRPSRARHPAGCGWALRARARGPDPSRCEGPTPGSSVDHGSTPQGAPSRHQATSRKRPPGPHTAHPARGHP